MSIKTDFKIDKLGPVTIMEPKVKTKIKFLQKIFIKLFGYKEVCTLDSDTIKEIEIENDVFQMMKPICPKRNLSFTFTVENAKWNDDFINEIRKEENRRKWKYQK